MSSGRMGLLGVAKSCSISSWSALRKRYKPERGCSYKRPCFELPGGQLTLISDDRDIIVPGRVCFTVYTSPGGCPGPGGRAIPTRPSSYLELSTINRSIQ